GLQLLQPLEAVADGAVVGQGTAQPALADVGHAAALGLALDGLLGLARGADGEGQAALGGGLGEVAAGPREPADGLTQVDDVDEVALAVDERPHLGVPPTGTVPEVDSGLDQVLDLDNRHALPSCPTGGK